MAFFSIYQVPQILPRKLVQGMQCYAVNENGAEKPPEPTPDPLKRRTRYSGVCKWYSSVKFWGFLERKGEKDIFVHGHEVKEAGLDVLLKGQKVSFEIDKKGTKIRACSLKLE